MEVFKTFSILFEHNINLFGHVVSIKSLVVASMLLVMIEWIVGAIMGGGKE